MKLHHQNQLIILNEREHIDEFTHEKNVFESLKTPFMVCPCTGIANFSDF